MTTKFLSLLVALTLVFTAFSVEAQNYPGEKGCYAYFKYFRNDSVISIPEVVPFSFSAYSEGKIAKYFWDFGDGYGSQEANPTHVFNFMTKTTNVCLTVITTDSCKTTYCENLAINPNICVADFGFYTNENEFNSFVFYANYFNDDIVTFKWDMGDGTTSNDYKFIHKYEKGGVYNVCLDIIKSSGEVCSTCKQVIVPDSPVNMCNPSYGYFINDSIMTFAEAVPISFIDQSFTGDKIKNWYWQFGDGTTSTEQNPLHVYNTFNTDVREYKVCLTIETESGCKNMYCAPVSLLRKPECSAKFETMVLYSYPPIYVFSAVNPSDNAKYEWKLGDGTYAYGSKMEHKFIDAAGNHLNGVFPVCLSVNTAEGCSDVYCEEVVVGNGQRCKVGFDYVKAADSLKNAYQFIAFTEDSIVDWMWKFSDGTTANGQNIVHQFSDAASHLEACLVGKTADGCEASVCQVVQTSDCYAYFTYRHVIEANTPNLFQFYDNTKGNVISRLWTFGDDGSTSTEKSPLHHFPLNADREYKVILTVTTDQGCTNTYYGSVVLFQPQKCSAQFESFVMESYPMQYVFSVLQYRDDAKYEWKFGDGTYGYGSKITHQFLDANGQQMNGVFSVCLNMITPDGCSDFACTEVVIGDVKKCNVDFKYYLVDSAKLVYQFKAFSNNEIVSWQWKFGDGTYGEGPAPLHEFQPINSYFYPVCVTAKTADGCEAQACNTVYQYNDTIIMPGKCFASFDYKHRTDVKMPYLFDFVDLSQGNVVERYWDFGDGNFAKEKEVTYGYIPYPEWKPYTVCLKIRTADGCESSYCQTLKLHNDTIIVPPVCDVYFTAEHCLYCSDSQYHFMFKSNVAADTKYWYWSFGDGGTSKDANPHYRYAKPGVYEVNLTASNDNDCKASHSEIVVAGLPYEQPICKVKFEYSISKSYPPQYVFKAVSESEIVGWYWRFSDGTYSLDPNPMYIFNDMTMGPISRPFEVTLVAVMANGCISKYSEYIYPNGNEDKCNVYINLALVNASGSDNCEGSAFASLLDFAGQPVQAVSYQWSTGQTTQSIVGLCNNIPYSVSITDVNGCQTKTAFVLWEYRKDNLDDATTGVWNYVNTGSKYDFTFPISNDSLTVKWDFGNGVVINGNAASFDFGKNESQSVNLTVTDKSGRVVYQDEIKLGANATAIDDNTIVNTAKLYPNPVSNSFTVELNSQITGFDLQILNNLGQVVMYRSFTQTSKADVDVSSLPNGFYVARITSANAARANLKFIKE